MINYQEIIENLSLERVENLLNSLQIPFIEKDTALIMPTVCHNASAEEASWKLYYYKDTHLFYCYTEDGPMSIFKFLQHFYDARGIVYDWYNDVYNVIISCTPSQSVNTNYYKAIRDDYKARKARKELPVYPKGILDVFVKKYPVEWLQDNISKEAMDKYNIKYSISQNKIIIPHYNIKGELVGIRGRALNVYDITNFGKYMPVQIEGKWYSHPLSLNLYGLDKNWQNIKQDGIAFIFESEKSVLQCESFEMKNYAVASCGSNLNKFQIDLLVRYCSPKHIVVCYDNEELEGEEKYFQKLYKMCSKYKNYCSMSFIYDRENITDKKDSPSDKGEAIFLQLLKERVKIR